MAFTEREVIVVNPAEKRKRNMAQRHMSAKQIRIFGTKRQKAALRAARHKARTKPAARQNKARKQVHRARPRPATRKRNVGEILFTLGNPAHRKGKAVAQTKERRGAQRKNAGKPRMKHMKVTRHHRRRSNPADVKGWVTSGLAVVGGAVGSKVLTQVILGTKNTSWTGYAGNGVATGLLGWAAHMVFRDKMIAKMVVAGGVAQIIVRMITDKTQYGQFLLGAGLGDYQVSHFLTPQRMVNALQSAEVEPPYSAPATVVVPHSAASGGMGGASWDWN